MHQHTFTILERLFDELKKFIAHYITMVKNRLAIRVYPIVSKIDYADGLPVVRDLTTATIDDVCNLVRDYKLQILTTTFYQQKLFHIYNFQMLCFLWIV